MIFVTVGTHHQPFDRLLDALSEMAGREMIVQYGTGSAPSGMAEAVPFMPFDRMQECFEEAEKVIVHAGEGSIVGAIRAGHVPLIVPRRHDFGEHVDEHQAELTRAVERLGSAIAVWDVDDLASLLARAPVRGNKTQSGKSLLCDGVRAALLGDDRQVSDA